MDLVVAIRFKFLRRTIRGASRGLRAARPRERGRRVFANLLRMRFVAASCLLAVVFGCSAPPGQEGASELAITHGPMLGRAGAHQMGVWARTAKAGSFVVRYGTAPGDLSSITDPVETALERDNTGWTILTGLAADTEYFYEVAASRDAKAEALHSGSFRTWPDSAERADSDVNPAGAFNFSFEFACGNNQNPAQGNGPGLPTYNQMLANIKDDVDFAVLNGDWLYEEKRDYAPAEWLKQVGAAEDQMPDVVRLAPTLTGVWENYKLYLSRAKNLSEWHREVPSFYTFDDHEILNDIYGTADVGRKHRRTVFRDIGVEAWYDYLGWSNPEKFTQGVHFGRSAYKAGSDILEDADADFSAIDFAQAANLMVHWGGPTAGVNDNALDLEDGDPNAGVYEVVEVLDKTHLRVRPAFKADGEQSYSIGRRSYSKMRVSNADVYFLDTRSHRDMHDVTNPNAKGVSMIGEQQEEWLVETMKSSDAEMFFLFSSVNFMIPHVGGTAGGEVANLSNKDEAWSVFLENRERLIEFWDSLGKPVFVLTGDLHNSFAIKITDRVWEFAGGPHNSRNHAASAEAGRPANGDFDSRGRVGEIRWSTYVRDDAPSELNRHPAYTVVQVNNVFNNPVEEGKDRWVKFPHPQIIFQYYSGLTGDLLYAESILAE